MVFENTWRTKDFDNSWMQVDSEANSYEIWVA